MLEIVSRSKHGWNRKKQQAENEVPNPLKWPCKTASSRQRGLHDGHHLPDERLKGFASKLLEASGCFKKSNLTLARLLPPFAAFS